MKIELNPSHMSIKELTDCIAELSAQRERLIEERREEVEGCCYEIFLDALVHILDAAGDDHDITLILKGNHTRAYDIPLTDLEHWDIEVKPHDREVEQ